ncbi:hypothetical protein [Desulfosporosinus acididurans]|nr:hypothetical protein [Desulfosporosinus acididurans]
MKEDSMVNTRHLRRLRFIEAVILNIPFILVLFLYCVMPINLGFSQRITTSLVLALVLWSIKFGKSLNNLYYCSILPFMKPLWEYEQQKLISDKGIKRRRKQKYGNALIIIGLIIIIIFPLPMPRQFNWYSFSGSLIGYNIGMMLRVFTEEFDTVSMP